MLSEVDVMSPKYFSSNRTFTAELCKVRSLPGQQFSLFLGKSVNERDAQTLMKPLLFSITKLPKMGIIILQ